MSEAKYMELLPRTNHKYKAIFYDINKKKIKTIQFGQKGALDFTKHKAEDREARKKAYIIRHEKREDWTNPLTAGALSKYLLWNLPTLKESWADYKKRFNIKKLYRKK